jgi:hypothetical protein
VAGRLKARKDFESAVDSVPLQIARLPLHWAFGVPSLPPWSAATGAVALQFLLSSQTHTNASISGAFDTIGAADGCSMKHFGTVARYGSA